MACSAARLKRALPIELPNVPRPPGCAEEAAFPDDAALPAFLLPLAGAAFCCVVVGDSVWPGTSNDWPNPTTAVSREQNVRAMNFFTGTTRANGCFSHCTRKLNTKQHRCSSPEKR